MAAKPLPDITDLRNRVAYDAVSGRLTWLARPVSDFNPTRNETAEVRCRQWNSRCAGKVAFGTRNASGYLVGPFRANVLLAHRVAFAIQEGRWPELIDHINGDRSDNRWTNLRETTPTGNLMNCALRSDSSTGRTGVRFNRRKGCGFIANIKVAGKLRHLGTFDTIDEATAAREAAELKFGFSPRHGRPL